MLNVTLHSLIHFLRASVTSSWFAAFSNSCRNSVISGVLACRFKSPFFLTIIAYKKSLPVRNPGIINSKQYPLYQLPIWLHDEDVDKLSDQLLAESSARTVVNYISAPSHFGKTACVLPAFLNSTVKENGFTHYLYLSCDNNNSNYFCSDGIINENKKRAECQGGSFIFECLKILLTASSAQLPHLITVNEHPPTSDESVNKLRKLFADMAPNDETSPRILVHIDEHRKMCPRNESSYRNETRMCEGALFSKGAMSTLVRVPGVSVIATYTEQPPLPPEGSSGVCRRPVPLPSFNVDAAMQAIKELKFHHSQKDFDGNQKRLWATLRFRLTSKLESSGMRSHFMILLKCSSRRSSSMEVCVPRSNPATLGRNTMDSIVDGPHSDGRRDDSMIASL